MAGFIKWTVILSMAGSVTAWVFAMGSKLTSEQMGMLMMALIIIAPLSAVLAVMTFKADADRRMDHIERVEREKTERKRRASYDPPVVIVVGNLGQQPAQSLPAPVVHNHNHVRLPDNNVSVQTALLPSGKSVSRIEDTQPSYLPVGSNLPVGSERRYKIVGMTEEDERRLHEYRGHK